MIISMTNHGPHNVFPLILNDTPARRALEHFVDTMPNIEDCYHIGDNGREDDSQKKFFVARKSNDIVLIEQSCYYDMGLW